jgi:hypothetical protein
MRGYVLGVLMVIGVLGISGSAACIAASGSPPIPTDHVRVVVSRQVYALGEEVLFKITNTSPRTIYYTFGCSRPLIYKFEGQDSVALTTNTDDSIPFVTALIQGETNTCRWDQRVWQDPNRKGSARFQHYNELGMILPGQYRFRLDYYLDLSDVHANEKAKTVYSDVFTIR